MIHILIQKVEQRKNTASRFHFDDGMSYEVKYQRVNEWWNDFRFHLSMAVKSPTELNRFLDHSLSSETMYLLTTARKKGMPYTSGVEHFPKVSAKSLTVSLRKRSNCFSFFT